MYPTIIFVKILFLTYEHLGDNGWYRWLNTLIKTYAIKNIGRGKKGFTTRNLKHLNIVGRYTRYTITNAKFCT